ncbi:MAG: glycoside hydrolase family 99-like domain-containing protein [Rhodanobacter lindaniclasticus]
MMAAQEQPRVLLVLGMHRSGTSAAARVVNLLGANLGNNLIEPGPDNPDGFWEHAEAVRINDALLEGLGRTWYDMREMPQDWQSTEAAGQALVQIETLIRQDFQSGSLWAIKDPRMCLTAPIWIRALRGLGYAVDCLFVVRNPREVVDSLHVRNNWVRGPLYLMWVQYLMEAEAATRHERRALITYDELLAGWRGTMEHVAAELGLVWPVTLETATTEVHAFLNKGRRHHVANSENATGDADNDMPELAGKLYQACLSISRDEKTWSAISRLEKTYRSVAGLYAEHVDLLINLRWQAEARAQVAEARAASQLTNSEGEIGAVSYEKLAENIGKSISGSHDLLAQKMSTVVSAMAGGMDHLESGFMALQKELRAKAHKDEEREVASEARMGALESAFYDLSKRAATTEVQLATLAGEVKARVERQQSVLAELGTTCGSLAGQLDTLRADSQSQAHGFGESLDRILTQVDQRLIALNTELKAHAHGVAESSAGAVNQMEQRLVALDTELKARIVNLTESNTDVVDQLDQRLMALDTGLKANVRDVAESSAGAVSLMKQHLADLAATLKKSEQNGVKSGVQAIQRIEDVASELRSRLEDMQYALGKRDIQVERLLAGIDSRETKIHQLESSTSWRITAPLRWIRRALMPRTWKAMLGRGVKSSYERLPLPTHRRLALKGKVFRTLAPLIRNTRSYRAWQAFEAHRGIGNANMPLGDVPKVSPPASPQPQQHQPSGGVVGPASSLASHVLDGLNEAAGKTSSEYVAMDDRPADLSRIDVRAIAFYLPQFHPIPENDAWWGRGFTEWTNVSKAVPQFVGHYQPRLPGELGFYDLRLVDVMRRQVELARHYGLQGFCFHYYWFGGRRLLERPLEQFLANSDIDFPFCICWANENWSRRWDGLDQDILIGQNHSPEDDIAFITALEPLLRDPRYIKIDGKPLIVLYRPSILPDAKATQQRWREHCRKVGIGEIVLAMVQFDVEDPRVFGFDVAIEFPPHKLARGLDPINDKLHIVNPEYAGYVVDYDAVIERAREHSAVDFDMIRGVFPSWDNEARKPGRGYTFANATPARYREWMDLVVDYARRHPVAGERLVFINAWNEWAEGAHLEPDRRYGYAYLDQTRAALQSNPTPQLVAGRRVAIISHDANPHGAQYLALNMARELASGLGMQVDVLLMEGGQLAPAFAETARVHDLAGIPPERLDTLLTGLRKSGVELVIANTAVSGRITQAVAAAGLRVVTLVHELPRLIRDYGLEAAVRDLVKYSDKVILPSTAVRDGLSEFVDASLLAERSALRPQGLFTRSRYRGATELSEARARLRAKLGLEADDRIVLAVGYADRRKGVDLLLTAAAICCKVDPSLHFVWVGHLDETLQNENAEAIAKGSLAGRFHFVGLDFDTDDYYAGSDLYALPSREDPFPSVVLESLSVGVPVVAFAGTGGGADLLRRGVGAVVPAFDVEKYAAAIMALLADDDERQRLGRAGSELIDAEFSFRAYVMDLLCLGGMQIPRVSVVVPNFNYARYLPERLACIAAQSVPVYEIIILDDGSSDDSIETVQRVRHSLRPEPRIIVNHANSGSVFRQWQRGVQLARGEYVWIAEADDLAMPEFLERMLRGMSTDQDVLIGYCQSEAIDERGRLLMPNYLSYTNDLSAERWAGSYVASGVQEVDAALGIKNTIPNVSAVLFRRQALREVMDRQLDQVLQYKVAGDWLVYLHILKAGKVFYDPQVSNRHRRHGSSVTLGMAAAAHYREVVELQERARSMFPMSARSVAAAEAYRAMLSDHLGIAPGQVVGG